jgi:hypothetical protein
MEHLKITNTELSDQWKPWNNDIKIHYFMPSLMIRGIPCELRYGINSDRADMSHVRLPDG